jgi:PHP-associated
MKQSVPRVIAAIALAAGVAIGTLSDTRINRSTWSAGGYQVLAGDFHVHAFPGDGALAPWMLRDEAARAGLDVFAVTNHNRTFTARFAGWLSAQSDGPLIIPGEEITAPDYHLIALGVHDTVVGDGFASTAIAAVHAQGGVAIAAHPLPTFHGYDDDAAVAALDGVEAAHPVHRAADQETFAAFFERGKRLKPGIAPIGSSDFHVSPEFARCRTFLFVRERTAEGVLDAIRSGRTVASDQEGRLYGDAGLIQLLADNRPTGRSDVHAGWRRVSLVLTWIGVLGILVLKRRT